MKYLYSLEEIDKVNSTNAHLQKLRAEKFLPEGYVISAKHQQKGKGQAGNAWTSAPGENVTFSLNLLPVFLPAGQFFLSMAVSVGICDALEALGIHPKIKWPNDILINDNKVCGILIEHATEGNYLAYSTVGVGLNVNQKKFPPDIPSVTSLSLELQRDLDLHILLDGVINGILHQYNALMEASTHEIRGKYLQKLFRFKELAQYKDEEGEFFGEILDVESAGELIIRTNDRNRKSYLFKEVQFI